MGERLPEKFRTGNEYSCWLYFKADNEISSFGDMFTALCSQFSLVQVA